MLEFQPGILYNKSCSDFIKIKIIEQENCRFCVEYAGGGTGGEIVAQETLERIRQAEEKGVKVYGLSGYYVDQDAAEKKNGAVVLLGYANMSEQAIREAAALLGEAWKEEKER